MVYNLNLPVNSVSFGHCSIAILRELYLRDKTVNIFWAQTPPDFSAYKLETDFQFWLNSAASRASKNYRRDDPVFRLWHIRGAEASISNKQTLFTFHEVDELTQAENNILRNQQNVLVSSRFSENVFKASGLTNVTYCPLGFDNTHFKQKARPASDKITFSLFGKFEKRKHTEKVIRAWLKKYKNDSRYVLNLHVYNPFFTPEQNHQILANIFGGHKPFNVNCIGYVPTLREFNDGLNACDIVLDMSGGEGFSIPSFSAIALGKYGVVHNCSSIKDWAGDSGATLINPVGKEPIYDGHFFKQGDDFNQGDIFVWDEDQFLEGCENTISLFQSNPQNIRGLKLQDRYTWSKTVDIIENTLQK